MKRLWHVCTGGCGSRQHLRPDKKHYCKCNPSAPFVMMVEKDRKLAHQIVKASATKGNDE